MKKKKNFIRKYKIPKYSNLFWTPEEIKLSEYGKTLVNSINETDFTVQEFLKSFYKLKL